VAAAQAVIPRGLLGTCSTYCRKFAPTQTSSMPMRGGLLQGRSPVRRAVAQDVPDRLPVDPGRLHRHVVQPPAWSTRPAGPTARTSRCRTSGIPGWACRPPQPHAGDDNLLVHGDGRERVAGARCHGSHAATGSNAFSMAASQSAVRWRSKTPKGGSPSLLLPAAASAKDRCRALISNDRASVVAGVRRGPPPDRFGGQLDAVG